MKLDYKIFTIVVFLIFLFFSFRECSLNKKLKSFSVENEILIIKEKLKKQSFDSLKSASDKTIYRQTALLVENDKTINILSKEIFNLKKKDEKNIQTIAYLKSSIRTKIDTFYIPYTGTDSIPFFTECKDSLNFYKKNGLITPKSIIIDSPFFKINETIKKEGVIINNLEFIDTLHQRIVENKKTIEVHFFHTNPYIRTVSSNFIVLNKPIKTFWQKIKNSIFLIGIGVAGGFILK